MTARLINTTPETSTTLTEVCSAVGMLFLETSGKYFDLQISAVRSSLDSFRHQFDLLNSNADGNELLAGYSAMLNQSIRTNSEFVCQSLDISAGAQRQCVKVIDQGWWQLQEFDREAEHKQQSLATLISNSLALSAAGISRNR